MQIAKSAYETETKHEYAKHSVAIGFLLFVLGKNADFRFRSLQRKKTKRIKCKALWRNFFLICVFHFVCFCGLFFGMFPCCVVFALFMYFLFPLKCSILRHNNITIDLRWSLVADEVNKKIESWFKTTDQLQRSYPQTNPHVFVRCLF